MTRMFFPISLAALCAALLLFGPAPWTPASAQSVQDRFEVAFQKREAQRRASIAGAMRFTEEEAADFWPLYDQYRLSTKALELRRLRLLQTLSENGVGMEDETASEFVDTGLSIETESAKNRQGYVKRVGEVISGARYVRLFQIEMKLDAMLMYGATQQIPLAVTEEERDILESQARAKAEAQRQRANAASPTT
ncbi:MAG: hypothetical protein AAF650_03915 [Pseudomonadota bacterium]